MRIIKQQSLRLDIREAVVAPSDTASISTTDLQITLKGSGPWPMKWRVASVVTSKDQTVICLEAEARK